MAPCCRAFQTALLGLAAVGAIVFPAGLAAIHSASNKGELRGLVRGRRECQRGGGMAGGSVLPAAATAATTALERRRASRRPPLRADDIPQPARSLIFTSAGEWRVEAGGGVHVDWNVDLQLEQNCCCWRVLRRRRRCGCCCR